MEFITDDDFVLVEKADASTDYQADASTNYQADASADYRGDVGYYEHSLGKKGTRIQVFKKILDIDTGVKMDKGKTIGTISEMNSDRILMCAHSGYSTDPKREAHCLNTQRYNSLALSTYLP